MKKRIVFATNNAGKMKEVKEILADMNVELLSMKDLELNIPIDENGTTFEENAIIKAKAVSAVCGEIVLADDSGLEIDYLNKEPGIYSARYMGESTSYSIKNAKLIERLDGVPEEKRTARFICAIAAVFPSGEVLTTHGEIEGIIGYKAEGTGGFGYDPIFYIPEFERTTAQLSEDEKNAISHRGKALFTMKEKLKKIL